jgi:hypothetical protein
MPGRTQSDDGASGFVHTTIKRFDEDQARQARITRLPGDNDISRRTKHDYFSSQ